MVWTGWRGLAGQALVTLAGLLSLASPAGAQQTAPAADRKKVIVVSLSGPLYYGAVVPEVNRIIRGVKVQKPDAVILVFSSPDGQRELGFEIAEEIAGLEETNVVALVKGEHGGVFGPAAFPLFACRRVFVAQGNTIELQPAAATEPAEEVLTPREVSLLQTWAAMHRRPWSPIKEWLDTAALLASGEGDGEARSGEAPGSPASRPAASRPGSDRLAAVALRIEQAADVDEVMALLGLPSAAVITWPDPIAKTNEQMQRIFQAADNLVKKANAAIGAARNTDPRAFRYELRDISREYDSGIIVSTTQPADVARFYTYRSEITDRNVFADGGVAWRTRTERCLAQVRKAMEANRDLARLVARYPEIDVDPKELDGSYETLRAWQSQLRSERNLRSPP